VTQNRPIESCRVSTFAELFGSHYTINDARILRSIASGALAASPALAARLTASEAELSRVLTEASAPAPQISEPRPRLENRWRSLVSGPESALTAAEVPKARTALRGIVGDVQVVTTPEEIRLETQKGTIEGAFLRAAGTQQINLVAGARFAMFRHCRCASV
jgi:hypothetical protein